MKTISKINCRRSLTAFCLLILLSSFTPEQINKELTCSVSKSYSTGKNSLSGIVSTFLSPPMVYYFTDDDWKKDSGILVVHSMNVETGKKNSFTLNIPGSIVINEIPAIALNEDYLILTDDEYFSLYRFKKTNNQFRFMNKIKLPERSTGKNVKYLEKNKFLFYCFYNFHPSDSTYNSNIGVYDASKDSVLQFTHPEMPCIGFSHFQNAWLTFNDNLIALASPCGYKIRLYDFNLNPVDSIDTQSSNIKNYNSISTIPFETSPSLINPKLLVDKLLVLKDTVSRIEKIFFMDNSTLLVSSTGNKLEKEERRIDLWDIRNLSTCRLNIEKNKIDLKLNDTIYPNQLPLPLNNTLDLSIKNNIILTVNDEDYFPDKIIKMTDFLNLKNQYYENNDPDYSIHQYILPRLTFR